MCWKSESGQALILAAFSMVVLIVFIGLGVDMGISRRENRVLQNVVDSATYGRLTTHFSLYDVTITTKLVCLSSTNLGFSPCVTYGAQGIRKCRSKTSSSLLLSDG